MFLFLVSQKFNAQCTYTITSIQPYYEGFNSITANNQLPLCWLSNNPGTTCLTYTTALPNGPYAAFYDTPVGINYFYSKGVYLISGVTYSASVWFKTDNSGGTNWTDLSLLYSTTQSATGLVSIASTSNVNSPTYVSLSNTFVASSSGVYYLTIRGTSSIGIAHYLYFDDVRVTLPCGSGTNTPSMTLTANTTSICSGEPYSSLSFAASGANIYSWNTGATTPTTSGNVIAGSYYEVIGTNTLTQCTATLSKIIAVLPAPNVLVYASVPDICMGMPTSITAVGAVTYSWSTGASVAQITVSPSTDTSYSVVGTATNGCTSSATQIVSVHPLPIIVASVSSNTICKQDSVKITASGGITYTFTEPGGITTVTNNFNIAPIVSATYSLSGKDAFGCTNTNTVFLLVNDCTGLKEFSNGTTISLYPNPNKGEFVISAAFFKSENNKIIVYNSVGQKIMEQDLTAEQTLVKPNLSTGLYYYEVYCSGQKITSGKLVLEK